jgi:hypothetical protein
VGGVHDLDAPPVDQTFDVLVHDERDGHARVEVVDHPGAAGAPYSPGPSSLPAATDALRSAEALVGRQVVADARRARQVLVEELTDRELAITQARVLGLL